MSVRYTLRLTEDGAEVWQRWTGDRDEAARLVASALVDLGKHDSMTGLMMMQFLKDAPDIGADGMSVYSRDLRQKLDLSVRQKGHNVSSE